MSDAMIWPQERSRLNIVWLAYPVLAAGFLAIVWCLLWLFAVQAVRSGMESWIQNENEHGRTWNCSYRQMSGFPYRIDFSCANPTVQFAAGGAEWTGHVVSLHAYAEIYQPDLIRASVSGPFILANALGEEAVKAEWDNLNASFAGLGERKQVSFSMDQPKLTVPGGILGASTLQASTMTATISPASGRDDKIDYDVAFSLNNADLPAIDSLTGSAEPVSLNIRVGLGLPVQDQFTTIPQMLDKWRLENRELKIASLGLTKGNLKIEGDGTLKLDNARRAEGRINARLTGLEPLLARYGIPVRGVDVDGMLNSLFGKGDKAVGQNLNSPKPVSLPLLMEKGRVSVGPFRTKLELPPLY